MSFFFSIQQLFTFIDTAGKQTYAGGAERVNNPERPDFNELTYEEGDWLYRDSYIGFYRSRGMEVVRLRGEVVWTSAYGGGMTKGNEELAEKTFAFLKKALLQEARFSSVRGPAYYKEDDWEYKFKQEGTIEEFVGYEEILNKNKIVFFHRIIGGIVKTKQNDHPTQ